MRRLGTQSATDCLSRCHQCAQELLPIWRTPGGKGHYVSVTRLLELLLPHFVWRVTANYPEWPSVPASDGIDLEELMLEDGHPSFEIAITFDGRSKPRQHFLSAMLVIKQAGLQEFWQKPDHIYTICEVEGHDSAQNMRENIMPFWAEVQALINGKKVTAYYGGRNIDFNIVVRLPADMKAQWALFGCGGSRSDICHRCHVTYEDLETVFVNYIIKVRKCVVMNATK